MLTRKHLNINKVIGSSCNIDFVDLRRPLGSFSEPIVKQPCLIGHKIGVGHKIIVKIDSTIWSFCLCHYVQNGLSYLGEEN